MLFLKYGATDKCHGLKVMETFSNQRVIGNGGGVIAIASILYVC